jgi:hypothetical protein
LKRQYIILPEITLFNQQIDLNKLWGQEQPIMDMIDLEFSKDCQQKPNKSIQPTANASAD